MPHIEGYSIPNIQEIKPWRRSLQRFKDESRVKTLQPLQTLNLGGLCSGLIWRGLRGDVRGTFYPFFIPKSPLHSFEWPLFGSCTPCLDVSPKFTSLSSITGDCA